MAKDLVIQISLVDRDANRKLKSFKKVIPDFGVAKADMMESVMSESRLINAIRYLAYLSDIPEGDVDL